MFFSTTNSHNINLCIGVGVFPKLCQHNFALWENPIGFSSKFFTYFDNAKPLAAGILVLAQTPQLCQRCF